MMKERHEIHRHERRQAPKRLVRLVLQADDNTDLATLRQQVDLCLATVASKYLADLLTVDQSFWDYHEKVGRRWSPLVDEDADQQEPPYLADKGTISQRRDLVRRGQPPGIPFRLEPVLPDRKKRPPTLAPELARFNFLILTLPLYESDHRRAQCNPNGALFDVAYTLRKSCGLISVVPAISSANYVMFSSGDKKGSKDKGKTPGLGCDCPCPEGTTDYDWHRKNINYDAVPGWVTGLGAVIGHPDTGWTPHSELNFTGDPPNRTSPNFVAGSDINILDPNAASRAEELVPSPTGQTLLPRFPYHGTRTAGLMVSNAPDEVSTDQVRGLAPEATIVSIRCVDSVILWPAIDGVNLANAIFAAVDAGVHVISMSLGGGFHMPLLQFAIHWAVAHNVIVVAAAGNYYPFVAYPAAYPACIGVGGSTIKDAVWSGSGRNLQFTLPCPIDVSAPAECVWNPFWRDEGERSSQNDGTSFSAAIVAGAASLWLQRYNRNLLIAELNGRVPLQELFRAHLHSTARRPSGWNVILDGPGILDLSGLMNRQTLPNPRTFGSISYRLDEFANALDQLGRGMQEVLDGLGEFGNEISSLVMNSPIIAEGFQAIETAINIGQEIAADAAAQGQEALDNAEQLLEDTAQAITDAAEEVITSVAEAASNAASNGIKTVTNTAKKIKKLFQW